MAFRSSGLLKKFKEGVSDLLKKAVLLLILFLSLGFPVSAAGISAKAAAVVDESTGRLIYGLNENARLPMASTTKIMTGLIAVESGKLDEIVTVSPDAVRVEGSSMGLLADEKITLRNLTYGLMLESGNDAANAIAISLGGSIESFVDIMNNRAAQLGLTNTHFVTPSGLDAVGHYTSALDLARLGAYAMRNQTFSEIVSTTKVRITDDGKTNGRTLTNHNRLLKSYDGAIGIKTGFTKKCGRCLVSCAQRNGVCLVVCTLNDPDDWDDHKKLLDSGFKMLKSQTLLGESLSFTENVAGGLADTVKVKSDSAITAALRDGEASKLRMQVQMPRFVYAPVQKGEALGKIVFSVDGSLVAGADLKACASVAVQPAPGSLWSKILAFFYGLFHRR